MSIDEFLLGSLALLLGALQVGVPLATLALGILIYRAMRRVESKLDAARGGPVSPGPPESHSKE